MDTAAPVLDSVGFTFLDDGAAVIHWVCTDGDVDHFEVYQNGSYLGEASSSTSSYNVTTSPDGGNSFTIRAVDKAGNIGEKTVSVEDQELPTAPSDLQVMQKTTTFITLSWTAGTDNMGVAGYNVYQGDELVGRTAGTDTVYTVTGLEQGTEYTFTVRTRDRAGSGMANDGESIFWNISGSEDGYLPVGSYALRITATDSNGGQVSEEYTVMLKRDDEAPTVPGIPTAVSHSTTTITLAWTASTDNVAVDHYEIYRGSVKVGESERTTYTDTGLEMSKAYSYTVKAVDARGNTSNASAEASLSTMELAFDSVISFNSSYTMEEQKNKRIDVWAKFKPETGYTPDVTMAMEYKFITAVDWTSVALDAASGDASLFQGYWSISGSDTGYLPAGSYQVRFAVTDGNATAYSETQTVALSRDEIAPVVESISPEGETMSGRELTISAHATDNVEVERVLLSYAPEGAELFTELGQMTTSGGDHFTYTWDASQLKSGNYTIKVEAYDLRGNMGNKTATITVDNTAPIPPESFFVGGNSEKITVMWSYPALTPGSDFKAFRVYRSAAADGEFMCVKELSTIGYYDTTETGILANMTYYYYVTAVDQYGNESVGTEVRSGQLTNDTHVPVIHSILPVDEAVLQKSAEFSVSATDNYMLGTCEIAYQVAGATAWTPLASLTPEATTRDHIYHFTWDLTGVEAGAYTVRFTVQDGSGLSAETTRNYTVRSYSAPQAPSLTAVPDGHKIIRLSWTYGGDTESLQSFALYRGTDTDGKLSYVCGLSADTRQYLDQVRFDGESQTYRYQVVALDQFGARAESAAVSVTAVSNDSEPPVAVIGPANLTYAAVGTPIDLTGEGSTDNDAVVSYTWNFGDGGSAASMKTQHVYAATGTYTVTLTVADAYGNLDTDTVEITVVDPSGKDTAYTLLNLSICDAITEAPIENAEITLDGGAETIQVWTDADGAASCVVPNGSYSVGIYADSYLVRTVTLEAAGGTTEHTIGLTNGSIMSGSLTATEMTYDEIVTAGIDPNAPGNQHVYKFAAELTFTVGLESYQLPYTVYKNAQGQILSGGGSGGGFFTLDGVSGGFGGLNIGLFPITENFVLVIYGEARWLKEMYNVELVVMNHSATDTLDQVAAELELPEGLSLADMVDGAQSAIQNLGNVGHNETATARWYVRGDQEGEYNLTAKVHAVSMPYGEVIQQTFTTQEPLKVYAGSALRLTVTANDFTERGEQYPVTLRLENVSDKSIYNLSFGVTGVEQFKVLRMGNQTVELPIDGEDFEDQFIRTVPELAPGGYMEIEISSTIWFNSIAEVGEAALKTYLNTKGLGVLGSFVNVGYYLQDISVVTLEGSTTTIPYTIQVKQTDRPDFLLTAYEAAKDLYEGEEPPSTLMDMMVEVFGNELPIWAQEGAKVVLSLPQGTTDYDVRITLADGTQDGQTLCNEYVSITSGTGLEAFFEDMNTITIRSDENGSFAINGLKAGDTELNISVSDKDGFQVDYKIPLHINDEKVDVKFDLGMDPDTGEFSINSDMIGRIVESLQGEEKATFEENPFLWFASHLELNLEASEEGLEDVLSLDKDTLNDLLAETALSYLDMNGGVASLSLDRETLQQVENAKSDTEAVRIILRELGADAAEDMFGVDRPTYEFMIQVGEDVGKTVSQFGEGQVQVEIPYELQDGESAEDIVIQRVEEDGSYELVPSQYDSAAGLVSFTTDQFSYYRIGLSNQQMPEPEEPDSGGGSIGSSTNQNTETVTNTDGSTTTTVTNSDGSTTATTEAPNGSSSTVNTSKDGKIEANVTLSSKAVQEAKGEPIALPMPSIPGTTNKSNAPTVTVELPSNTSVKIEIPVENVTAGTVAVLVKADGTEEIVKASVPTEAGVVLMVSNGDTVKIVDNTVSFADVSDTYWGADAIVFVYSRALFNGTSATTFGPEADMTRAMLLTVLARYAGVDTSASDTWYGAGVQWAMDMGISDGTNLDSSITREQLATMLYRYAGEPEITATITGFPDTASVSDWASDAMTWAVQSGLIAGMGNNTLAPQGTATRAQVATILMRFIQSYITK